MEFTDEVHWAYVFGRDGRMTVSSLGKQGKGSWRVEKDELCTSGGPDASGCSEVWASGNAVELRREGRLPEEGILKRPRKL